MFQTNLITLVLFHTINFKKNPLAFLILDIETIPRPPIDEVVEEAVAKKVKSYIDRTGDDPENAESLIRSTSPFFGQLLCVGMRWLQGEGSSRDKVVYEDNEENKEKIEREGHEFVEAKWWYIERYECTLVKRDREWWCTAMGKIYQFHKEVEYYKKNGTEELKNKIAGNKPIDISKVEECLL